MTDFPESTAESPVVAKHELKNATAKFAAVLSVFGLSGAGIAGAAAQDAEEGTARPQLEMQQVQPRGMELQNRQVMPGDRVMPEQIRGVPEQHVQLLNTALETGDSRAALERVGGMDLNARQREAFLSISREEWATLRRVRDRLGPIEQAADCTGTCGGFIY